jgi:hypothetical protein
MSDEQMIEVRSFYHVEEQAGHDGCSHCGRGTLWTIVYTDNKGESVEMGTAWEGDDGKETADDICDLMNMAFDAGREHANG